MECGPAEPSGRLENGGVSVDKKDVVETLRALAESPPAKEFLTELTPGLKVLGKTISEAIMIVATPVLAAGHGVRFVRATLGERLLRALHSYAEKLCGVDEDAVRVPNELAVPILRRLTYVDDESIRDCFVQLLATASTADTTGRAHPSFIKVIDCLSPDEAMLLASIRGAEAIPFLHPVALCTENVGVAARADGVMRWMDSRLSRLVGVRIQHKDRLDFYTDNLEAQGILLSRNRRLMDPEYVEEYGQLRKEATSKIDAWIATLDDSAQARFSFLQSCWYWVITDYGQLFIQACLGEGKGSNPRSDGLAP